MDYSNLRKASRMNTAAKVSGYKDGGSVAKKPAPRTTVNIVVSPSRGDAPKAAPIAPAGLPPMPSGAVPPAPMPGPAPMPPSAGLAGLAALQGGKPPMRNGGKVTMKAGAGSGLGRIEKAKAAKRTK